MRTEKMYENFILELEWKHMQQGGNAGLFIYSDAITAPGVPFTRSVEVQIMDGDHGDMFAIHGAALTPREINPKGRDALAPLGRTQTIPPASGISMWWKARMAC